MSDNIDPVVVFEGPNRAGKTVTSKRLAEALDAVLLVSPPEELAVYRREVARYGPTAALEFYATGNRIVDTKIRTASRSQPVVVDRHYFSTVAVMSVIMGMDLGGLLAEMKAVPDRVYLLTAEMDELERRAALTGEVDLPQNERSLEWTSLRNYRRILKPYSHREIDTTHVDEKGVFEMVLADYRELLRERDKR